MPSLNLTARADEPQEAFYGREVITATREMVELESDDIMRDADKVDVAFLVVGDPLGCVLLLGGLDEVFC